MGNRETMEIVIDFNFLGSEITAVVMTAAMKLKDDSSLEGKLWKNLDSILKSRDITLPKNVHLVKAMVFPVVMYGCESWAIKKAKHWRVYDFWAVVLEKTLESLLDCKAI